MLAATPARTMDSHAAPAGVQMLRILVRRPQLGCVASGRPINPRTSGDAGLPPDSSVAGSSRRRDSEYHQQSAVLPWAGDGLEQLLSPQQLAQLAS